MSFLHQRFRFLRGFFSARALSEVQKKWLEESLALISDPKVVSLIEEMILEGRLRDNPALLVKGLTFRFPFRAPAVEVNFEALCPARYCVDEQLAKLGTLRGADDISDAEFQRRRARTLAVQRLRTVQLAALLVHEASHVSYAGVFDRTEDERLAYQAESAFLRSLEPEFGDEVEFLLAELSEAAALEFG